MTRQPLTRTPAGLPRPPVALSRALAPTASAALALRDLDADGHAGRVFVAAAGAMLPGRHLREPADALRPLGDERTLRLVLLAAGVSWLRRLADGSPFAPALLRHSVAAAVCCRALARTESDLDERGAFALGLLHHVGDAAALRDGEGESVAPLADRFSLGGDLLRSAGLADPHLAGFVDYGRFILRADSVRCRAADALAAADRAASLLGYVAPSPLAQPACDGRILDRTARLLDSKLRLSRTIEGLVGPALDPRPFAAVQESPAVASSTSPLVLPETLEGVSARDLGPLPALFTRLEEAADEEGVVAAATAGLVEEFGFPRVYFLHVADGDVLRGGVLCSRGNAPLPIDDLRVPLENVPRAMRLALETGRPILQQGLSESIAALGHGGRAATFYVPVQTGRRPCGVMAVEVADPDKVLPDLLLAICSHTALALERAVLRRRSDEAKTDELTGLYNRRGILEILDRWIEEHAHEPLAIALFDCDHLKKVNDNFGHLMGDEFVRRISEVLRRTLRKSDELGRYGGDEFLAVLPGADLAHVEQAMERCRAEVERAGLESDDGLLLSVSVGACVRGRSGATRERLLKLADHALYRAKERGRNAVDVIDAENPPELAL